MIRVVIIEDLPDLREAIRLELNRSAGIQCVGTFPTYDVALADLFAGLSGGRVDVVLMDLTLPGLDGIDAMREIKTRWPRIKLLVFSMHDEPEKILAAFNAGADGYLLKTAPQEELAGAIARVHTGGAALSPRVQETLVAYFRRRQPLLLPLTETEKKILAKFDRGESYKQVADEMGVTINTIRFHVKNILVKTIANSVGEAAHLRKQLV